MSGELPDQATLRGLLDYDPSTGILRWRQRGRELFRTNRSWRSWNTRYAAKPALTALNEGYPHGEVFGKQVRAHRVIWKWMTGTDPDVIDHIDGNPTNNRWANLRSVHRGDNQKNLRRFVNNSSGRAGVSFMPAKAIWQAYIGGGSNRKFLGYFSSFEDAAQARAQAEERLGYHPNHGRSEPVKGGQLVVTIGEAA